MEATCQATTTQSRIYAPGSEKLHQFSNGFVLCGHQLPVGPTINWITAMYACETWKRTAMNQHINNITNKANSILGLLRRNLRIPSQTIKTHAYQSLVRPHLEYASTVWDPHTQKNIHKLDMVQRRAARYTCNRYHNISSVTEMVGHLGWEPLATRRRNMRLCMMYKIAHTVVGDPWTEWLTTSKRVTRGFHAWKYIPIYSHHNIYKFSFLPRTIIDWNSLSPHSVDSPSIDTFRARITRN